MTMLVRCVTCHCPSHFDVSAHCGICDDCWDTHRVAQLADKTPEEWGLYLIPRYEAALDQARQPKRYEELLREHFTIVARSILAQGRRAGRKEGTKAMKENLRELVGYYDGDDLLAEIDTAIDSDAVAEGIG